MRARDSVRTSVRVVLSLGAAAAMLALHGASAVAASGDAKTSGPLRAGAAKVDITPPLDALSPTAHKSAVLPVMSIRDHLHVRATYFENGTTCGALIGVEQGAMRGTEPDVQKAAQAVGCPRENIIASAVHTAPRPSTST
jgi:hypothetical protein